jgi:hypothetical protein
MRFEEGSRKAVPSESVTVVRWTVMKVDSNTAIVEVSEKHGSAGTRSFSLTEAPYLEELFDADPMPDSKSPIERDVAFTLRSRTFRCLKLTWMEDHTVGLSNDERQVVALLSPGVRLRGIVRVEQRRKRDGALRRTLELRGFGTRDTCEWGDRGE